MPQAADAWLSGRFSADQRNATKPERMFPREFAVLSERPVLAEHDYAITVSRDECEVADQWQFASLAGYIARSREVLVMSSDERRVRAALHRPLTRLIAELRGPLYFASRLRIRTRIVQRDGGLAVIHEGFDGSFAKHERPSYAAIEWFDDTEDKTS